MDIMQLFESSQLLVEEVDLTYKRYLYQEIDWDNRLIVIRGPKGVGKSTMIWQRMKEEFYQSPQALYVPLDNIWFSTNSLVDLAHYFYTHGGTHLFLDEVHKYPNWIKEVKNIYDMYPKLHIIVTGSSMLNLSDSKLADISRRRRQYDLAGLSFREFLHFEGLGDYKPLSLEELVANHYQLAAKVTKDIKVLPAFEKYLQVGFYPFYKEDLKGFSLRLQQVITTVIESEIPAVGNLEYESVYKIKRLLGILAQSTPYTLNLEDLAKAMGVARNTLLKMLDLMDKAALIRRLFAKENMGGLKKPEKILFDNANIMNALSPKAEIGTQRETFAASLLSHAHEVFMPKDGDLLLDNGMLFEVGGKNKKFNQIKDLPSSYVLADDIESGFANRLPLWTLGFLY